MSGKLDIPVFNNQASQYREFRKRCLIYEARMRLEGKEKQVGLSILGQLTGLSWTSCEVLADDPSQLESSDALKKILSILDGRFQYDKSTELPDTFEEYFYRGNRKPRETLFDFIQRTRQATAKVAEHNVKLPEEVQGWLLLRRAGLSEDQKTLVTTQTGKDLKFDKVAEVLQTTFGQTQTMNVRHSKVHYAKDEDEQEEYRQEDTPQVYYQGQGTTEEAYAYNEPYDYDEWYDTDEVYYGDDQYYDAYEPYDYDDPEDGYEYQGDGTEGNYDPDEFDDVFANYQEARKKLSELRTSRGFYPVVAMIPDGATSSRGPSRGKGKGSRPSGKSKGRGSKGRGKGKTKATKGKAKGKRPAYRIARPSTFNGPPRPSSSVCLRCGKHGHWASECPEQPRKRPNSGAGPSSADDAMMVTDATTNEADAEQLDEVFLQRTQDDAKDAVLDGGAQSFVVGSNTLQAYAEYLRTHGVDWTPRALECSKTFRFGNDETTHCTTATVIPCNFAGRTGHLHVHIIEGNTPFLFPRPLMEEFGLIVDYGRKRLAWSGSDANWSRVKQKGCKGHYLLDLADCPEQLRREIRNPAFQYAPFGTPETSSLMEIGLSTGAGKKREQHDDDDDHVDKGILRELPSQCCRAFDYNCQRHKKEVAQLLAVSRKPLERRRKCWLLYAGRNGIAEQLRQIGAEVQVFGLENDWNLRDVEHQRWLLWKLDEETPDEVWIAPPVGPWSRERWENARSTTTMKVLTDERHDHHENILKFAKTVFNKQVMSGRHAHLVHPAGAASWRTKALKSLKVKYELHVDQCMYGTTTMNGHGLVRKPLKVVTTKWEMCSLDARCDGSHVHVQSCEHGPTGHGKYNKGTAYRIALYMASEDTTDIDDILPLDAMDDLRPENPAEGENPTTTTETPEAEIQDDEVYVPGIHERMQELKSEYGERVFKYVRKLHNGMGHPSSETMAKTLANSKARDEIVQCAKRFECSVCASRKPPPAAAKAGPPPAKSFNERVQMDVFYVQGETNASKVAVLHLVDTATRFGTAKVLRHENSEHVTTAVLRSWIKPYGPPQTLQFDEARCFCGQESMTFFEKFNIRVDVAPGEAHTRLGIVERRHMVMRTAIDTYMQNENLPLTHEAVKQAVDHVTHAINTLSFTRGYTPAQWVLNSNPRDPSAVTADEFSPTIQNNAINDPEFAEELERRQTAKLAFMKADADSRIRRALLRRHRLLRAPLAIGTICYFWREAGVPRLQKSKWRGPATVIMREDNQDGRPLCYWIVHGTSLIRCAPEHVRPDVNEPTTTTLQAQNVRAEDAIRGIRTRSTTQYVDLRGTEAPPMDVDTDDEDAATSTTRTPLNHPGRNTKSTPDRHSGSTTYAKRSNLRNPEKYTKRPARKITDGYRA